MANAGHGSDGLQVNMDYSNYPETVYPPGNHHVLSPQQISVAKGSSTLPATPPPQATICGIKRRTFFITIIRSVTKRHSRCDERIHTGIHVGFSLPVRIPWCYRTLQRLPWLQRHRIHVHGIFKR
ncbi:hypothetical protein O9K51_05184 [Purpureocillium lavendulum]|uniref:Uncharacterized protein n=1 Tax=Purpureocillium lavendulum TaxID=1247861 RepID=A0AB34FS14_9HYPO|nr:hypothetical protein O9K51_05184 [Purpureocillium lavendulum]